MGIKPVFTKKGQSITEYVVLFTVITIAVVATLFIAKSRGAFDHLFNVSVEKITSVK